MNSRIQELAHQAEFISKRHNGDEWRWGYIDPELNSKLEKFADLLIKEALSVVSRKCASPTAYEALVEHFGIE